MRSWLACTVIVAGFIVGGVALIYWNWAAFWIGVALAVVGCIFGWAVNIMEDVTEYGGGQHAGTQCGGGPRPQTSSDPESATY